MTPKIIIPIVIIVAVVIVIGVGFSNNSTIPTKDDKTTDVIIDMDDIESDLINTDEGGQFTVQLSDSVNAKSP